VLVAVPVPGAETTVVGIVAESTAMVLSAQILISTPPLAPSMRP
jgi:hypothetical protein